MVTQAELATNNPRVLAGRIAKEFPRLKIDQYKFISQGWDHEVLLINQKIIFRFPNSKEYAPRLKNEIKLLHILAGKTPANIPNYQWIARDYSFGGYEILPGHELMTDYFNKIQAQHDSLARQLAAFLTAIHTLPGTVLELLHLEAAQLKKEQATLKAQLEEHLSSKLDSRDLSLAREALTDTDKALDKKIAPTFTHHDITERHLLWDEPADRLGVIDFSDMCLGDPAFDFAELYCYGSDFVQKVYAHYAGPKDNNFLRRAFAYHRRVGVFLLANSLVAQKISFEEAKQQFDRIMAIDF